MNGWRVVSLTLPDKSTIVIGYKDDIFRIRSSDKKWKPLEVEIIEDSQVFAEIQSDIYINNCIFKE